MTDAPKPAPREWEMWCAYSVCGRPIIATLAEHPDAARYAAMIDGYYAETVRRVIVREAGDE